MDRPMYYCAISLLSPAPSGMPQEVNIVATGTTTISIKWNAIDCTDRNSEISGYRVRYGPSNDTTLNDSIDDPLHTMYRATGLMNSTDYTFEVAAESSSGTGPFSIPIIAQTSELFVYLEMHNFFDSMNTEMLITMDCSDVLLVQCKLATF